MPSIASSTQSPVPRNGCAVAARWRRIARIAEQSVGRWIHASRIGRVRSRSARRTALESAQYRSPPVRAAFVPLSTCSADHDPPIAALNPNESPSIEPVAAVAIRLRLQQLTPASRARSAWPWIAAIAIVASLGAAVYAQLQLGALRKESARRFGELEQATARATDTATRADAEARAARERAMVLEARLAEEQGQREALEQLYTDLSRGRDEAVLVEVERLVAVASQELSVSGNLNTALAALQTADLRLARSDSARFLPLRRVIARDIERLKVAPSVDVAGMALKLDQIAAGVDNWPLLSRSAASGRRAARAERGRERTVARPAAMGAMARAAAL